MKKLITNSEIKGVIEAPASKSIAQRAIIAALLARGKTSIKHLTPCDDTLAALNIAQQAGCHITHVGNDYEINSPGAGNLTLPDEISCGESGLLARVMIPIASLDGKDKRITGHGTLLARPVDTVLPPLSQLGVTIQSPHGHLPLTLKGPLKGGKEIQLDGSLSSQFLTGLLMALPLTLEDSSIRVNHLKSKPYIDLTIDLLSSFGIEISREDDTLFTIRGRQAYQPCTYTIEGDWSGASCLLVAGAIAGEITIKGLDIHTQQADVAILKALEMAGIPVSIQPAPPLPLHFRAQKSNQKFQFRRYRMPRSIPRPHDSRRPCRRHKYHQRNTPPPPQRKRPGNRPARRIPETRDTNYHARRPDDRDRRNPIGQCDSPLPPRSSHRHGPRDRGTTCKRPPSTGRRIISKQIIPRLLGYTRSTCSKITQTKIQKIGYPRSAPLTQGKS